MLMLALRRSELKKKKVSTHSIYFSNYRKVCLLDSFHPCLVIYMASATTFSFMFLCRSLHVASTLVGNSHINHTTHPTSVLRVKTLLTCSNFLFSIMLITNLQRRTEKKSELNHTHTHTNNTLYTRWDSDIQLSVRSLLKCYKTLKLR